MKFKSDIEIQAGVEAGGSTGSSGQVLSSTGSGVAWIDQSVSTSASDFVFFNVKNGTGSTILKGKGVMAVGTDGNSGHILVDEMVADGSVESKYFLGVLEEDIPNGGFARAISFGQLSQFDTRGQNGETWADGQVLWCDPANNGDFTITEPDGPNVKIAAAFILNSSTNGKIQVRVQANEGIHDLHDTKITSQVDGDVLVWDNTTGVWFNDSTLNVDYTNSRVGIGTDSPSQKLEVAGNVKITDGYLQVNSTAGANVYASPVSKSVEIWTVSSELGGDPAFRIRQDRTTKVDFGWDDDGTSEAFVWNYSNGGFKIGTNGSERFKITSTGKVGIGTTSPSTNLQVQDDSFTNPATIRIAKEDFLAGTFYLDLKTDFGISTLNANQPLTFQYNNSEKMRVHSNGNIGIGTTNPSYKLDVNGEGRFTGDVRGLSFIATSQRDQKEGITDITKTKAKIIPFKEYTYKSSIDGSSRKRYGVVAEDIENDYPELVHTGADGIKGVNYIDLLVKRVAELEKELEDATSGFTGTQIVVVDTKGTTATMTYSNGLLKSVTQAGGR